MTYLYTAIWPVEDTTLKLPGLILLAEPQLELMLDQEGVTLLEEPKWTLLNGRLTATAQARRRVPWDAPDSSLAYFLDLLPDGAV